jgi:hypothetical protein
MSAFVLYVLAGACEVVVVAGARIFRMLAAYEMRCGA